MTRQKLAYVKSNSALLAADLKRVLNQYRNHRSITKALSDAESAFNRRFSVLVRHVWNAQVKRDLENPVQLTREEIAGLKKKMLDRLLADFGKVLKDA